MTRVLAFLQMFYRIFIRGKIWIYPCLFIGYIGVRFAIAYYRWNSEEAAVLQKLALYKKQLDKLRAGALAE
ncbi:MAG: hypothetical protein NZL89_04480, partial [Leptospiraceae bacterium]|nr:hypothetical protein [Leptospiraceae bacterium]